MSESGSALEQPQSVQVLPANFGSLIRRVAVSRSRDYMACVLDLVSPFPEKNKAEVGGAHKTSSHRPETWNGERRIQPLVVYQRMSGARSSLEM